MARRRGFLRRILDKLVRRETPEQARATVPATPRNLRQKAINNFTRKLAYVNTATLQKGVNNMTPEELKWTAAATTQQLIDAARQDADRLTQNMLPLNPWWYH